MQHVQVIIVGQGFAGTALAWTLAMRGIDFVVVDSGSKETSSRIAAGLVTPITGKRAVKTWEWEESWEHAKRFYTQIEEKTKIPFWTVQPALQLFDSEDERKRLESRWASDPELVAPYMPTIEDERCFEQTHGGITIKIAARLDGYAYLNASRDAFKQMNAYHACLLDVEHDIEVEKDSIRIPSQNLQANTIVFCQGYSRQRNPWFSSLPLVPAQGDILTVEIPNFYETRTIHRGIWITPISNDPTSVLSTRYLVGSTYRWQPLDGVPSAEARQEILSKLSRWIKLPIEVVGHRSAVRPASFDHKPLLGPSQIDPRIAIFNGLGAKGTLMAPWSAMHLVDCLIDGVTVPSSLLWNRRRS